VNFLVFKQSFKYLKNEKINLSKVMIKLECLFYLNIYVLFYLILYSKSHFDLNKSKKRSNRKKITPYQYASSGGNTNGKFVTLTLFKKIGLNQ